MARAGAGGEGEGELEAEVEMEAMEAAEELTAEDISVEGSV